MTTKSEDERFIEDVIPATLLEESIEWIKNNLNPEDVFYESALIIWAGENDYTKNE